METSFDRARRWILEKQPCITAIVIGDGAVGKSVLLVMLDSKFLHADDLKKILLRRPCKAGVFAQQIVMGAVLEAHDSFKAPTMTDYTLTKQQQHSLPKKIQHPPKCQEKQKPPAKFKDRNGSRCVGRQNYNFH